MDDFGYLLGVACALYVSQVKRTIPFFLNE